MRILPPSDAKYVPEITLDYAHVHRFLNAPPKMCECGIKNHGWNRRCPCGKVWDVFVDVETVKRWRNYND